MIANLVLFLTKLTSKKSYFEEEKEQSLIDSVGLGDNCSDTVHCLNDTICISGQCKCPIPLIQEGNQCVDNPSRFTVGKLFSSSLTLQLFSIICII